MRCLDDGWEAQGAETQDLGLAGHPQGYNGFLRSLGARSYERLESRLKLVNLQPGAQLQRQGDPVEWVYFPKDCVLSLTTAAFAGQSVETSMCGNEGSAGLVEACGGGVSDVGCVVQVDGLAWRCPQAICRNLSRTDPEFNGTAWRLAELLLMESRQAALCQALHSVEQRFARWILESNQRSGGRNPLPVTQEGVASVLGVQRTTISMFASALQRQRLIAYQRGQLRIVNRFGLEARACECRRLAEQWRARLGFQTTEVCQSSQSYV